MLTIYNQSRLAAVYEALNPPGPDDAFYLSLAGDSPRTILDMGCGTGRLTCALASLGHSVTGAEPSAAMLNIARTREGADRVRWVQATAANLALETRFDLIIMTGHVFQVFLKDEEIRAALCNLRAHLAPGGRLAFETRNPLVKKWQEWVPDRTSRTVDVAGIGTVHVHHDLRSVQGQIVTYETHFRFPGGETVVVADTLRFVPREQLAAFLADAGFSQFTFFGDWDSSPFSSASPEIIVVAGTSASQEEKE